MIKINSSGVFLVGPKGSIPINEDDEITLKVGMLFEGECEGVGASRAARKFGYTRQRYYQILHLFKRQGAWALKSLKPGPKNRYRRTDEVIRQVIRYRFLDPQISPEVIAQKLVQCGYEIATRSVERVISEYGLQKKTPHLPSQGSTGKD
ncbi:MAG: helix-turn-helix domain-containing protein [Desulfobacteraceae bacterium]|nr:helix-turn-helix domain-containing protein [Desulfobacteraceae bacterium]